MIFVAFHGEPHSKSAYDHAHEPPAVMTAPLVILAAGALFAGLMNLPEVFGGHQLVSHWLAPSVLDHHVHATEGMEWMAMGASVVVVLIGIAIAFFKFARGAEVPYFSGFSKFAYNKFYIDELYDAVFVQPYKLIGSFIWKQFDPNVTDGPRRLTAGIYSIAGSAFKVFQTGFVRVYAIYMVIGLSLLSLLISQTLN
jgi:NADH-quinone oxidoreductase subunit L